MADIESIGSANGVDPTTEILTTPPLTGGGDLSTNRTLAITESTSGTDGYLSSADWDIFNGKMTNPMVALGDIIYGGSSGTPTKLSAGASGTVLHGGATPSYSAVVEADLSFSNNTTGDASSIMHGLMTKLSGVSAQFMNGQGNWVTPSGVASGYTSQGFSSQTSVTVTHNFGAYPIVQVIDGSFNVISPSSISHSSVNAFTVTFGSPTTGSILATIGSPQAQSVVSTGADYSIVSGNRIIKVTASGKTITLPSAPTFLGAEFIIDNASTGNITLATTSSQTIEGILTQTIFPDSAIHVYSDGSNYRIY